MKKFGIYIILLLIFLIPCNIYAWEKTITFGWQQDISPDFGGWKLYIADISGGPYQYAASIDFVAEQTEYVSDQIIQLGDTSKGIVYFVLRAFDIYDNESGNSNEVEYKIIEAPFLFRIILQGQ